MIFLECKWKDICIAWNGKIKDSKKRLVLAFASAGLLLSSMELVICLLYPRFRQK